MKKTVLLSLTIAFIFIIVWSIGMIVMLQIPVNRSQAEWETITNTEYNFSVNYPTKWVARTYSEYGYKGVHDMKLRIYRSLLGYFEIAIYYKTASEPTIQDVVDWGDIKIYEINQNLPDQDGKSYEEISLDEDIIDGEMVMRRIYQRNGIKNEDVYIARTNDMIIIRLQSEEEDFESYLEDFERIVQSFRPLE